MNRKSIKKLKDKIKNLIGQDRIGEAIQELHKIVDNHSNSDLQNQLIVLEARNYSEIKKFIVGIKENDIESNKIRYALAQFTDIVFKQVHGIYYFPPLTKIQILKWVLIAIILLALFIFIY